MALETTFRELDHQLKKLQDNLVALRLTVAEDQPNRGEAALADQLEDTILDAMGLLEDCMTQARDAQKAVAHSVDLNRARRALTVCQERFHETERRFTTDLGSYEKLRDLANLGGKRGGAWLSWASTVKHGLEECRGPMDAVSTSLAGCWQEIAERVGMTNISVQSTNIGQQITNAGVDVEEFQREGIP